MRGREGVEERLLLNVQNRIADGFHEVDFFELRGGRDAVEIGREPLFAGLE